jgi:hypothetical protein
MLGKTLDLAIGFVAHEVLPKVGALDEVEVEFVPHEADAFRASVSLMRTGRCQIRISSGVQRTVSRLISRFPHSLRRDLQDATALAFGKRSADVVVALCISFLLVHELAHMVGGHVDFFQRTTRPAAHTEEIDIGQTGCVEDFVRIREIEADGAALNILYRLLPAFRSYVGKRPRDYSFPQRISRRERRAMHQVLLFSALIASFQFDDNIQSERPSYAKFSPSRIVAVIVYFLLIVKRGSVVFEETTRTITCEPGKLPRVLRYFSTDILPVLGWCQAAADAAGFDIGLTEARGTGSAEHPIARDILAVVAGNAALSQSALAIHYLGPSLDLWYSQIKRYRKGKLQ